jgi:hypothetical protein
MVVQQTPGENALRVMRRISNEAVSSRALPILRRRHGLHKMREKRIAALGLHPHPIGTVVARKRATTVPIILPRDDAGEEISQILNLV